jgi:hypothetical protein
MEFKVHKVRLVRKDCQEPLVLQVLLVLPAHKGQLDPKGFPAPLVLKD